MAPAGVGSAASLLGALVLLALVAGGQAADTTSLGAKASNKRKPLQPKDIKMATPVGSGRPARTPKRGSSSGGDPTVAAAASAAATQRRSRKDAPPEWWPFATTCLSAATVRDNRNGEETVCATGTACLCPRYVAADKSWNCVADDVPCRNIPHSTPRYPTNTFQATLVGGLYDGSSVRGGRLTVPSFNRQTDRPSTRSTRVPNFPCSVGVFF
jgi:hypothetical protein